ncbi:hypothetical protein [Sulfuriroseicoccus oceanibius]|uniref:TM2 domain-containing protein n=1 Tax=Sulfuriroseicoccus oceanibius TaxID=2707525 RepID=A0A6B3LEE1_9BACT|nr:hypothetical protein [Sulfuriroseicoccus oceanibius]QQL45385.1 hypothetical protein G3M56_001990 [Sulfuriroseicoccus oceanibius]
MNKRIEKYESLDLDRNKIAAILSIIPGLGHLYKHHYLQGTVILTLGNMLMILVTALLTPATFGVAALMVPAIYLAGVGFNAYDIPDWHGRHDYLHPWKKHREAH